MAVLDLFFFSSLLFCFIYSDVNSMYLSSTEPPAAAEWACLLRPLRGREPEGIWNLLSIVREMFKRRDSNAAPLLEILTDQCLNYEQVFKSLCCVRGEILGNQTEPVPGAMCLDNPWLNKFFLNSLYALWACTSPR